MPKKSKIVEQARHRTVIIWKEERPHIHDPEITVKTGDWAQKRNINLPAGQGLDIYRVKAYIVDGMIVSAVLSRPDYDPCGRTDYYPIEVWHSDS